MARASRARRRSLRVEQERQIVARERASEWSSTPPWTPARIEAFLGGGLDAGK
ncbi:MAG TPA: hypothetical protein VGR62_25740 [Candidatus Binatia bacterium]|jgi:hypothetical protein|nr:hypothetical protein [Candidatus Binatia bacterium]